MTFPDFQPAPNQGGGPELYELDNRAVDPDGLVLGAMRKLAPWAGKTLVDLGCGSGYWLPGYAAEAGAVIRARSGSATGTCCSACLGRVTPRPVRDKCPFLHWPLMT